jgi:hypothetical protein
MTGMIEGFMADTAQQGIEQWLDYVEKFLAERVRGQAGTV